MANLLSTTVNGRLYVTSASDVNPTDGAFRFYDGTTFRGGLGLDSWAHSGSSNDLTLYVANNGSLFITTNSIKRHFFNSGEAAFRTYAPDLNYKISVTGGDQLNAYYGSGAATLYLQYHGASGGALNVANGKLTVNTAGSVVASGDMRAPIFYDSDDTGFYLDPNGTSNLRKFSTFTMAYNGMNPLSANSPYVDRYNGSVGYRNGTMGYGNTDFNTIARNWGSGFIDTWSSPANAPGGSTHYIGLQGVHYSDGGTSFYGFQMACAGEADNRFFWRSSWPSMRSWVEMIHSGNIASQSVSYAVTSGTSSATTQTNFSELSIGGLGVATREYVTSQGYLTSLPSHNHDDRYYTESESDGRYVPYGSIAGSFGLNDNKLYLRTNGDNNHYLWNAADDWEEMVYYSGTGFRIKGSTGTVPAYFNESGVYASAYRGKDNVGGTGTASWHPDGIYVGSTQWLYGTQYRNGSTTSGQGWMYLDYNYGHSIVGLYSSYRYQGVFAMGDSYKLPADGTGVGNLYGMTWSHPNAGGVAGNLNTHGLLVLENGTFLAAISGSIRSRDDMRAPIFYDSQNTAYYLDPASGSNLNDVTANQFYANGWFRNYGAQGIYNQSYGTHFYSYSGSNWGITGSGGDIYLAFRSNHESTIRGYVHANTSNQIGFLNNGGSWTFRTNADKTAYVHGQTLTINADNAGWSSIFMNDGDEGNREIHCNSNRIGFLTQGGNWGSWCDDDGGWNSVGNISGNYLYSNYSVRVGEIWGFGGLYRSSGAMLFGTENAGWSFRSGNSEKVYIATDGNIYMAWAGAYISTLLDAKQNASTAINTGNIGSQSVNYATSAGSSSSSSRSSALDIVGYGSGNMTYYQSSGTFAGQSGWAGYFISNHGDGATYYNQTIIMPFWGAPQYSRLQGGTLVGPYTFWTTENLNDYAPNMNQYVRTTDNVTFNTTTSPTILVNGHSDNTKGYRIHNTSGSSVSAMFTNSSNQLVIAAGAVDQINLNKKVLVNAVALGVNIAPSATAGRIDASNDIVAYSSSDERLKENITPIANALDKVKSLTGVEFDWKPEHKEAHGHEGHDTGIIAQQVLGVMPSAVRTNDTGYLAVRYEKLIGLLIEGMKEQQEQIEELKAQLNGLTK